MDTKRNAEGIYPMRVAVQLTGLSPDTIRAWERRYHAIEPVRTSGNTRKFTQGEVRRLLLLREATEAGHSIGNIAGLSDGALRELALTTALGAQPGSGAQAGPTPSEPAIEGSTPQVPLDAYLEALGRFDLASTAGWLRRVAALNTPHAFVLEVVAPLLVALRERRADARLGGPHVVVAWQQLSAVLQVLLEASASPRGTPELVAVGWTRQRHALGAMAATLLARCSGRDAAFLAPNMPEADALWAIEALGAKTVVFDLSVPVALDLGPSSFATMERMSAHHRVVVLGTPGIGVPADKGIELVTSLAELDAIAFRTSR